MSGSVTFLWNAARGNRLRPWRSPYLRWRLETYTGKAAEEIGLGDFVRLVAREKRQFVRFLGWTNEIKALSKGDWRRG